MSGYPTPWDRSVRMIVQGRLPSLTKEEAPPDPAQLAHALRSMETQLGYVVVAELGQYLLDRGVDVQGTMNKMGLPFMHAWRRLPVLVLVETEANKSAQVMRDIYRNFADPTKPDAFVELVELEPALNLLSGFTQGKIGTNFTLTAPNCKHAAYRSDTGADRASSRGITGNHAIIAVIDSGAEAGQNLAGWRDLTILNSATAQDSIGHGAAMVTIVGDVARNAEVHALRVTDSGRVLLWDLIAAIDVAAFAVGAHVVSMSLGLQNLSYTCGHCGGGPNGNRSAVFSTRFDRLEIGAGKNGAPDPVFAAAVGNDGSSGGFHWPAAFPNDNVVAVGAVTHGLARSAFSNHGTNKPRYLLCPGGEIDAAGNPTEWVGEGSDNNQTTYCLGTSPATAYAAGLLALHREDLETRGQSFDRTGILDRISNTAANDVHNEPGQVRLIFT